MESFEIFETDEFQRWFEGLRDESARLRIAARIRRLSLGNLGDSKSVRRGETVIVLLAGGDKSGQSRDIERAKALAQAL